MSIHNITRVELRDDTRRAIENLEVWLRRWIDTEMTAKFGNGYLDHTVNGNRIVKKDIVEGLRDRMEKDPERYPRAIDAIHLDDAITITCHPECYSLFKPGYEEVFPLCSAQAIKAQLDQIVPTRHKLSHANEISLPDGLLAVSTSTRIVEAIKKQFEMKNRGQEFTTTNHYVHARRRAAESVLSGHRLGHQGVGRQSEESSGVAQLPVTKGCGREDSNLHECYLTRSLV